MLAGQCTVYPSNLVGQNLPYQRFKIFKLMKFLNLAFILKISNPYPLAPSVFKEFIFKNYK